MLTRRDLLKSSLLLPALPKLLSRAANAQDLKQPQYYAGSGPKLAELGLGGFIKNSTEPFTFPFGRGDFQPVHDLGVTPQLHEELIDDVCIRVHKDADLKFKGSFKQLALDLAEVADKSIVSKGVDVQNEKFLALVRWIRVEAIAAYNLSRLTYASEQTVSSFDRYERSRLNNPDVFMQSENPRAVCSGATRLAALLVRELNITCFHIDGFFGPKMTPQNWNNNRGNHGWLLLDFGNGVRVPSDFTPRKKPEHDFALLERKFNWRTLPKSVRDWELFSWVYFAYRVVAEEKTTPPNLSLTKLAVGQWRQVLEYGMEHQNEGYYLLLKHYERQDFAQFGNA